VATRGSSLPHFHTSPTNMESSFSGLRPSSCRRRSLFHTARKLVPFMTKQSPNTTPQVGPPCGSGCRLIKVTPLISSLFYNNTCSFFEGQYSPPIQFLHSRFVPFLVRLPSFFFFSFCVRGLFFFFRPPPVFPRGAWF